MALEVCAKSVLGVEAQAIGRVGWQWGGVQAVYRVGWQSGGVQARFAVGLGYRLYTGQVGSRVGLQAVYRVGWQWGGGTGCIQGRLAVGWGYKR